MSTRNVPPPKPGKEPARKLSEESTGASASLTCSADVPTQRNDKDSMCHLCGKRPRWDDTRFGHHDGRRVCTVCIRWDLGTVRRRANAMGRTYLGSAA